MVNASLNWASIVGIVLAVGGAFLYFMRNFKPALARDYDVFFAAVGLLCGGILFFQGWRLDPILQFGQFLLAGTTVFFAYESVRLRGVTTEQARRSSYFEDEEPPPFRPRGGLGGGQDWDRERFDQPEPIRRRIRSREEEEDEFYRPRRTSRAAIPERAASRREDTDDWDAPRRSGPPETGPRAPIGGASDWDGPGGVSDRPAASRYSAGGSRIGGSAFGARRRERDNEPEIRRGSRPIASREASGTSSPRPGEAPAPSRGGPSGSDLRREPTPGIPQGSPIRSGSRSTSGAVSDADFAPLEEGGGPRSRDRGPGAGPAAGSSRMPAGPSRDNSSRFDD